MYRLGLLNQHWSLQTVFCLLGASLSWGVPNERAAFSSTSDFLACPAWSVMDPAWWRDDFVSFCCILFCSTAEDVCSD